MARDLERYFDELEKRVSVQEREFDYLGRKLQILEESLPKDMRILSERIADFRNEFMAHIHNHRVRIEGLEKRRKESLGMSSSAETLFKAIHRVSPMHADELGLDLTIRDLQLLRGRLIAWGLAEQIGDGLIARLQDFIDD